MGLSGDYCNDMALSDLDTFYSCSTCEVVYRIVKVLHRTSGSQQIKNVPCSDVERIGRVAKKPQSVPALPYTHTSFKMAFHQNSATEPVHAVTAAISLHLVISSIFDNVFKVLDFYIVAPRLISLYEDPHS